MMVDGSQEVATDAKRFCTRPCTDRNRWAWALDVNRRIWCSRWRVDWCDTSARLFSYCYVLWTTDGMTVRWAAA